MKKLIYSALIYSLAILAGCQQIDEVADGAQDNGTAGQKVTLVANIAGSTDTKVALTPGTDNNGNPIIKVDWKPSGEKFYVMGAGEIAEFTQVSDNIFEGVLPAADSNGDYVALYGSEELLFSSDFHEAYNVQDGTLDEKYVFMEAVFDAQSESITFDHVTSIFKLAFKYNDEPLTNITSVTVGDKSNGTLHEISITPPEGKEALNDDIYMHVSCSTYVFANDQMMFKVMAGDKEYEASLPLPSDVDLELGKLYTATVNLTEKVVIRCGMPKGRDFQSKASEFLDDNKGYKKMKFVADPDWTPSQNDTKVHYQYDVYFSANASDPTLLEVRAACTEFVFNEDCSRMFLCLPLESIDFNACVNTSNVTNMSQMFYNKSPEALLLTSLDLSCFNTSNVTNMSQMFYNCKTLTSVDLSSFNTGEVTNMSEMFRECRKLTSLDLSSFDTGEVTNMAKMFYNCNELQSLDLSSRFNTAKVMDVNGMFRYCQLLQSLDLSSFDTGEVTNMSEMFYGSAFTSLDLSSFDTSEVTTMKDMFNGCYALATLDLSNFNTNKVTDMRSMFYSCSNLSELDIRNFSLIKITHKDYVEQMFRYMGDSLSTRAQIYVTETLKNAMQSKSIDIGYSEYVVVDAPSNDPS